MGQLTFGGFRSERAPRDRLFLGFRPPREIAAHMKGVAQRSCDDHGLHGKPLAPERLHVTLCAMEPRTGVPETLVEGLRKAASRLEAAPFEVSFNAVASFIEKPIRRPVVLLGETEDLSALGAFRRRLVNGLVAVGLADPRFTPWFTPHVTLLYDDRIVPRTRIEPIHWMVRDFVLIHSHVGRTRHDVLGRWTLCG